MLARDLMAKPTITCHVNDPLNIAAQRMWDGDVGALAVVNDDGKLAGIVTDRDICMAAYTQGRALDELLVSSAMADQVISATPDSMIGDVEQLMADHQIRRIPIVDAAGKPIGIVSVNDLAIEAARRDTALKHGPSRLDTTLAAICQHRTEPRKAV